MVAALLTCAVLLAGPQAAPPADPPAQEELPVSLGRIQRALSTTTKPAIELKEEHPVFRLEVFGKKPTLEDILGEKFWLGPAPYGGMTHREFLEKVTPKELQAYGAFSGPSLLQVTALTLIEQWALKQAIQKFRSALNTHEREAARKEVEDALAALEKARAAAGLPPK
jgi:hypothetical protein